MLERPQIPSLVKPVIWLRGCVLLLLSCAHLVCAEEITIWSDNFDDGQGDDRWYAENGVWQMGAPAIGPETHALGFRTFSGTNCATTGLNADHPAQLDTRLIRIASFIVPGTNQYPRLHFWHWFAFRGSVYGSVEVREVGTANSDWAQVSSSYFGESGGVWSRSSLDLRSYAEKRVQVAFRVRTGDPFSAFGGPGWYVDDVALASGAPLFDNPEGFETGMGDWFAESGTWEVGVPTYGPSTNALGQRAFSGTNCAATVLAGDYYPQVDSRLVSPEFIVPGTNQYPRLRFWHWFAFSGSVYGSVEVREMGTTNPDWVQVSPSYFGESGGVWSRSSLDLRSYAEKRVQVAFRVRTGDPHVTFSGPGWYVDDVTLVSGAPIFNNPEDFETGMGDWFAESGTWEVGVPTYGPSTNALGQRAFAGTNSAGTVLAGDYYPQVYSRLVSPEFIVPVSASNPGLRFRHWYEFVGSVEGLVEIKAGTNEWERLSSQPYVGTSGVDWTYPFHSLTAYADQTVQVALRIATADPFFAYAGPGWYADNVLIYNEVLEPIPNTNLIAAASWTYTPRVVGSGYTFILDNAPFGMEVDTNGVITWSPTEAQGPRVYHDITLRVIQPGNSLNPLTAQSFTLTASFGTNTPASIAILYPPDDSVFTAPVDLPINVSATDPDDEITQVLLLAGTTPVAVLTDAPYSFIWTNAPLQTNELRAVATVVSGGASITVTSAPVRIKVTLAPPGPPIFSVSSTAYAVVEGAAFVTVTVLKSANTLAGAVNYTTANGSAGAFAEGLGDYHAVSGVLEFTPSQTSRTVTITNVNDPSFEGNQQYAFMLSLSSPNSFLGSPSTATITIIDDDPPGSTNSFLENQFPASVPRHDGFLQIFLEPADRGGQWRLAWEKIWRNSGDIIGGLPSGNYEVEFKPVPGLLAPTNGIYPVLAGSFTIETNQYVTNAAPTYGSLSVIILPSAVAGNEAVAARGQWRSQGEIDWHDSGIVIPNLIAGTHIVEFKSVANWVTPTPRKVAVGPEQHDTIAATYLVAQTSGSTLPSFVPFTSASSPAFGMPYVYNGQLFSDVGYGSGFAVKRRVVLTAAHVVFNDATLSFVSNVKWIFQRNAANPGASDPHEPPAQTPRGWYTFGGYAAARTNDHSPGQSSPQSQNLDVAALFFLENAARNGQSGYLVSEPDGTEWLQESVQKTLVGYPMEVVPEADRGRLHATLPLNLNFNHVVDRVFATPDIRGYPGMSGGPLCVKYTNDTYYPAAIYVGGSQQANVRAIDGAVADLINRAEVSANTGDNNTGGGVALWIPGPGTPPWNPGLFGVTLSPLSAVSAGGAWRVRRSATNVSDYFSGNDLVYPLEPGPLPIEFKPISGFITPRNQLIQLSPNQTKQIPATYLPFVLRPTATLSNGTFHLSFAGETGRIYSLDASTNLLHWNAVMVLTNPPNPIRLYDTNAGRFRHRFYRATEK